MQDYELREKLDRLDSVEGSGTWHISLYCRPDKSVQQLKKEVGSELAEAENIKSDDTRKKVKDSLSKIDSALKQYKETPERGIAVFSSPAHLSVLDGLSFDIPENLYHCGKEFVTEPLWNNLQRGGKYGLIVLDTNEATLGVLSGETVSELTNIKSSVMGKSKAGGWSQKRFQRERERQKQEFFKEIADKCKSAFLNSDLSGLILGGTDHTVREFTNADLLHYELENLKIGEYSIEYANQQGLEKLAEKASNDVAQEETKEARKAVEEFFHALRENTAAYGPDSLERAFEYGAVDTLIVTTNVNSERISELRDKAQSIGGDVVVIEPTFEKAEMFDRMTNGVGAVLRYEINHVNSVQ